MKRTLTTLAAALVAVTAAAHVTLAPGNAVAGQPYDAVLRVGHACKGARATTAITVTLPEGFVLESAESRGGWATAATPQRVEWRASSPAAAGPGSEHTTFTLHGRLPDMPGPLWFKVLQTCDQGSADWSQVPASPDDKPGFPAARLDVAPGVGSP
jgi:periplasmic copper chaperone A